MTTRPPHPRARRLGVLGVAFYALLSPSGKIISGAVAATLLAGGLVTQLHPPSPPAAQVPAPTPVVPTRLAHSESSAPVFTYIEVDGQTLPVVLAENPTGNSSVGHGPASASPALDQSGGGGRGPGAGSPHFSPRQASLSPGTGGRPPEASRPDGNPLSPPTTGHLTPLPRTPNQQLNCTPATVSAPDSESPNALPPGARPCPTHLAGSNDPADNDSSEEGSTPPQDKPQNELLEPTFLGNIPSPFEAPESEFPIGTDDPLNTLIPLSAQPDPLLTAPYDSQSPPQTTALSPAAVPEPSMTGLILLGLAALAWTGRLRFAHGQQRA